jgi:hypothetical protein
MLAARGMQGSNRSTTWSHRCANLRTLLAGSGPNVKTTRANTDQPPREATKAVRSFAGGGASFGWRQQAWASRALVTRPSRRCWPVVSL